MNGSLVRELRQYRGARRRKLFHHLDPRSKALFEAATHVYEPRKIIKYEQAGRYPDLGKPALYACTEILCSQPIFEGELLSQKIREFQLLLTQTSE